MLQGDLGSCPFPALELGRKLQHSYDFCQNPTCILTLTLSGYNIAPVFDSYSLPELVPVPRRQPTFGTALLVGMVCKFHQGRYGMTSTAPRKRVTRLLLAGVAINMALLSVALWGQEPAKEVIEVWGIDPTFLS